ncbi:hypothetical protein FD755_007042, partial [Muntiacus reevesi]
DLKTDVRLCKIKNIKGMCVCGGEGRCGGSRWCVEEKKPEKKPSVMILSGTAYGEQMISGQYFKCLCSLKERLLRQWALGKNKEIHYFRATFDAKNVFSFSVRKDIVRILPSLDVEVKDITDNYDANWFLQVLSTQDLYEMTNKEFPIVAEVIEAPQGNQLPISILQPGKTIVIHKKCQASKILASEIRSNSPKRHFLIPTSYKGRFKRRPREFPTAYDLEIAKSEKEPLHVVATKGFHSPFEELSSVSVGDEFLVHHSQTTEVLCEGIKKVMDVLACEKILKNSREAALLPLYMDGGFVEVIHDKKLYQISELCAQFRLPFNVKVSVRDLFIEKDILAATPGLQLEESITNSYLLISDFANPKKCWEIPIGRVNMTVQLVNNFSGDPGSLLVSTLVEEITEEQYYMIRRYEGSFLHPPPRPPKHPSVEKIELTPLSLAKTRTVNLPKSPKFSGVWRRVRSGLADVELAAWGNKAISKTKRDAEEDQKSLNY